MVVAESIYAMNAFCDDHFGEATSTLKETVMDKKLTPEQNLDLIKAVGGIDGALQVIARNKVVVSRFPTTLLVDIGKKHHTGFSYLPALLEKNSVSLHGLSACALTGPGFKVSKVESSSLELVSVCPLDLGYNEDVSQEVFFARAQEYGLGMCPHETAVQLLLQIGQNCLLGYTRVASKPIILYEAGEKYEEMLAVITGRIYTIMHDPKRFIPTVDKYFFMRL